MSEPFRTVMLSLQYQKNQKTMVTDEFIEQVSEALDQLGYSVEQEEDVISDVSQIDDDVTLPGIRVQSGTMTGYVSMKLAVLKQYLDNTVQTIQQTWDAWFSDVLPTGVRSIWNTWFGTSDQEGVRKTWGDWFTERSTEWGTLKIDAQTATTRANNAASSAEGATAGAENVNAGIQGFTVTITDRNGVSRSVDIGFDIYRTYPSVAAMNADAANVPQGKFVIIATTDKTSEDNAKMYCKNSQGSFSFLCDLDQASSAAWADWLNNMKPAIEQATTDANNAAANANNKAALANDKAGLANEKAALANEKAAYAKTEGDRAKNLNDHPAYVGEDDYWYLWNEEQQQYVRGEYARGAAATISVGSVSTLEPDQQATVRNSGTEGAVVLNFGIPRGVQGRKGDKGDKGDDLDYSTMTPEEKSELNDTIVQHIVSENILGPTYDEAEHGFNFPKAMHVEYDEDEHGFNL